MSERQKWHAEKFILCETHAPVSAAGINYAVIDEGLGNQRPVS